jgi:hypothetical protein
MTDHDAKTLAQQALLARPGTPRAGQHYRHYKGGLYTVLAISLREYDLEPQVTYRSETYGTCWTRSLANFLEHVEPDCPRFALEEEPPHA